MILKSIVNTLVSKALGIQAEIPSRTELINNSKYDADKIRKKKIEDVDQKLPNISGLVKESKFNTNFQKLKIKYMILVVQYYS